MRNILLTCLLSLTAFHIADLPEIRNADSCEVNEVPNTITLGEGDGRVAWTAIMDREPYVLVAPIMQYSGTAWEPLINKTSEVCKNYDFVKLCCKDKNIKSGGC